VGRKNPDSLFVVKASGDSLDQAKNIPGGPVEDGDYVIIDGNNKNPQNGDYVLSVMDEQANLKRFYKDKKNRQIRLVSESSLNLPPIIIDFKDYSSNPSYFINGVVIRIIKK
jgi:SOS-response transcriptional repressor LexA